MTHPSPSDTLGFVEWEIIEASNGRTIHSGSRDVSRDDTEVVRAADLYWTRPTPKPRSVAVFQSLMERVSDSKSLHLKRLRLEGGFYLELLDRPKKQRKDLRGFSLEARHETTPTHSFGFFVFDRSSREHAKNREGGRLRIGMERCRLGWEIGSTEFLTDVSFEMQARYESGRFGPTRTEREPRWRIRIAKGSRVSWPSVDELAESAPD